MQWPAQIAPEILDDMLRFKTCLLEEKKDAIVQLVNAYHSILIYYKTEIEDFDQEISHLKSIYQSRSDIEASERKLWKIPVCYDPVFGIDLSEISKEKNCSFSDIVQWHSEVVYQVYFIGFLPGFLYLGGLDPRLEVARKKSPRHHIEKGAVAIGGNQTGIYPNSSPGGWNIIGNSPVEFFNPKLELPCFARAGDRIQFVPIDLKTHKEILSKVREGKYNIKSEVCNG